jgi:Domain of unknown function (DUF6894)
MKTYMIISDTGPIVILTSHASLNKTVVEKLATKGIDKFLACEIPIALAEERYGAHFSLVKGDLRESDELRVLDEDGQRAFALFRFDELGPATQHELPPGQERRHAGLAREERLSALPRFYMRLTNGKRVLDNHEGIDLPGIAAAREVAAGLARDLKYGTAMPGFTWAGWFVVITDQHGRKVDEIAVADI